MRQDTSSCCAVMRAWFTGISARLRMRCLQPGYDLLIKFLMVFRRQPEPLSALAGENQAVRTAAVRFPIGRKSGGFFPFASRVRVTQATSPTDSTQAGRRPERMTISPPSSTTLRRTAATSSAAIRQKHTIHKVRKSQSETVVGECVKLYQERPNTIKPANKVRRMSETVRLRRRENFKMHYSFLSQSRKMADPYESRGRKTQINARPCVEYQPPHRPQARRP